VTLVLSIILGLIVLGILVFVHELGHFLAAKACGIRVLAFSLGFGNPVFKKNVGGTEYRISSIPFGGYVKMAGENPEEATTGAADEFRSKPVWQRMTVAIAGPFFNYITAFFMLWLLFVIGIERPLYMEQMTIGGVEPASSADSAGILAGDSVTAINGKPVENWEALEEAFILQEPLYKVDILRNGTPYSFELKLKKPPKGSSLPEQPTAGLVPAIPAVVGKVVSGHPAEKAGFQPGDTFVSIDGTPIHSWYEMQLMVSSHKGTTPLSIVLNRKGTEVAASLLPEFDKKEQRQIIGINGATGKKRIVKYPAGEAFFRAAKKTWTTTTSIFDVLGKLVKRKVSPNLFSGPLNIIPASGYMVLQGLRPILSFMALISINLAVLNLLPLIITDGGLIFFMIIEVIRRKPLSLKTQLLFNNIALALFLALFLFVSFNDAKRLPEYLKMFGK